MPSCQRKDVIPMMQAKKGSQNNTRVSTCHLNVDAGVRLPDRDVDATVIMLESYKARTCSDYAVRCFSRKQSEVVGQGTGLLRKNEFLLYACRCSITIY